MIASTIHHDEDDDIELLRKAAIESLKRVKEHVLSQEQTDHCFQGANSQPHYSSSQPETPSLFSTEHSLFPSNSFPSMQTSRLRMPYYHRHPHHARFGPPHPPLRHAVRPFNLPHLSTQPLINSNFTPIPHVNPQFIMQQQHQQQQIFRNQVDYVPTPAIRLSPRSAEFIAANEQAILKASSKKRSRSPLLRRHKSRSTSRSKSRSPMRHRSRSPGFKRRSPSDNFKRYRSKSPDNRVYTHSPKNTKSNVRKGRDSKYNVNTYNSYINKNKQNKNDKNEEKNGRSQSKDDKIQNENVNEEIATKDDKSSAPIFEEKSTTPPLQTIEKKTKTQEELEDELLASTDDDEDGDQLDINMDDNELDFLEDDSESENEGRFKSKSSSNSKSTSSLNISTKNVHSLKSFDKLNSLYDSNNKSSRYNHTRDDDRNKRRENGHRSENRKISLNIRKKSPNGRKNTTLKSELKKDGSTDDKIPMFKSTFKSIDSSDKKSETSATTTTKKKSVTLVRSFVNKRDYDDKNSCEKLLELKSDDNLKCIESKKKIKERLGEYVGAKGKTDGNRSWAVKKV